MKQVLITGAFGFVGNALARYFLGQGWRVRLLDLPGHPLRDDIMRGLRPLGDVTLFESDVCDEDNVLAAVGGCDEVVHAAALLNSIAPWEQFRRVNVTGTQTLANACVNSGVQHLTLISTSDVFGIPKADQTIDESTPYSP